VGEREEIVISEIIEWHTREAAKLKTVRLEPRQNPCGYNTCSLEPVFEITDQIRMHERFAKELTQLYENIPHS